MEEKRQLPEGYTPLEYIEYRPKQERLFTYGRFEKYKYQKITTEECEKLFTEKIGLLTESDF